MGADHTANVGAYQEALPRRAIVDARDFARLHPNEECTGRTSFVSCPSRSEGQNRETLH